MTYSVLPFKDRWLLYVAPCLAFQFDVYWTVHYLDN